MKRLGVNSTSIKSIGYDAERSVRDARDVLAAAERARGAAERTLEAARRALAKANP